MRNRKSKLRLALLATAASAAPTLGFSERALAQDTAGGDDGVVIVVTAQKREESVQDVPISIQALTPAVLEERHVEKLDDYVKLLPSVSISTLGPGQSSIFFRGISTGAPGFAASSGTYFDETPVTSGGASLDLHVYDVARVEALSGPQGTLYGASSLSGTLRIISNQPDTSGFYGAVDLQAGKYGEGEVGGGIEGFVNVPLSDRIALRVVGYYSKDGGYIDNVPGSVTYTLGDDDPSNDLTVDNADQVEDDYNSLEVYGGRAALGIDLDDDWTITAGIMAQRQHSRGSYLWDPEKGDLAVSTYSPIQNDDKWWLASLTLQGKVSDFDLLVTGSYLDRHQINDADYTYYSVAYDAFPGVTMLPLPDGGFLDPTQAFHGFTTSNRQTLEARVNSPADKRVRATLGAFYQRSETAFDYNYYIPGVGELDPATLGLPPVRGDTIFLIRTFPVAKDYALFGELSFDLLDNLTLTGGIRGFKSKADSSGFVGVYYSAFFGGCDIPVTDECVTSESSVKSSGETHRVNLTWHVDDDRMLFATYSTGFRVGGPNALPGVDDYKPDKLSNYEVGFKTLWLDRMLRFNGAVYYEKWSGIQYRLATPGANGLSAVYNAGDARVYGAEIDFQAILGNLTLTGTGSYNDAKLTTDFCNIVSAENPNPYPTCSAEEGNVAAPKGTRLPNQPKFKTSLTGRYEFATGEFDNFLQASVNHQSSARNYLGIYANDLLGNSPGFTTFDFSLGTEYKDMTFELFIENAFDKRGELNRNTFCQITICGPVATRVYSIKPQYFGVKFGKRF